MAEGRKTLLFVACAALNIIAVFQRTCGVFGYKESFKANANESVIMHIVSYYRILLIEPLKSYTLDLEQYKTYACI